MNWSRIGRLNRLSRRQLRMKSWITRRGLSLLGMIVKKSSEQV